MTAMLIRIDLRMVQRRLPDDGHTPEPRLTGDVGMQTWKKNVVHPGECVGLCSSLGSEVMPPFRR